VFPGVPEAVGTVRAYLKSLLDDHPMTTDALLLASEIATNAIRHSRSSGRTFTVTVIEAADRLRVEVTDLGGDRVPKVHDDVDAVNGRGLLLVATIATHWGVDGDGNGRTVWFVLAARRPFNLL